MNAMELIISKTDVITDKAWKTQKSFLTKAVELKELVSKTCLNGCIPNKINNPEKYEVYKIASENYHEYVLGVKTANPYDYQTKVFKTKSAYIKFKELEAVISKISYNPDKYLEILERDYREQVIAKLKQALIKKEIDKLDESVVKYLNINESIRGYTITALLNGVSFETDCIGAGGHNIQSFHYRYLIKYKK